jgi:hypothetical protein
VDITHDGQSPQTGDNLAQQVEPFGGKISLLVRQARHIATRARQAGDQPGADRVPRRRKDDWDRRGCILSGDDWRGTRRDDDIDPEANKLGREFGVAVLASSRPAILDGDVTTFYPAELA